MEREERADKVREVAEALAPTEFSGSWAEELVFERYRRMTPWEKAAMLSDMCRGANQLSLAGLRQRHPGMGETALQLKLAALRVGREKVMAITGIDPDSLDGPVSPATNGV